MGNSISILEVDRLDDKATIEELKRQLACTKEDTERNIAFLQDCYAKSEMSYQETIQKLISELFRYKKMFETIETVKQNKAFWQSDEFLIKYQYPSNHK